MHPPPPDIDALLPLLARALEEDRARHDVTSRAMVPADAAAVADVVARRAGTVAGLLLAEPIFRLLDPEAGVERGATDGDAVAEGRRLLTVRARARAILAGERTFLDFLGRLSGIASLTQAYVERVAGTGVQILDTRKTTPGWRRLEKYAVRCGGGLNHRLDLADAAMVKENHLYAAFGHTGPDAIREAVRRCREALEPGRTLYVEVETVAEYEAAAEAGADVVMLDAFALDDIEEVVRRNGRRGDERPILEVTGGVDLDNVARLAATGVDRLSVGALTHSAPQLDVSLRVRSERPS